MVFFFQCMIIGVNDAWKIPTIHYIGSFPLILCSLEYTLSFVNSERNNVFLYVHNFLRGTIDYDPRLFLFTEVRWQYLSFFFWNFPFVCSHLSLLCLCQFCVRVFNEQINCFPSLPSLLNDKLFGKKAT